MARETRNRLINGIVDREIRRVAELYIGGRLIDIGCGEKPYASLIGPHVTDHVGVDHAETLHDTSWVDVVGSAYAIPVEDETFDTALCTSVLEHLEEPEQALRECYRVLRPGAHAVYTIPHIWHLHEEPRDFYRFTKYGISYLLSKVGFEIVELKALGGFWITSGQLFAYYVDRANRGPLRLFRVIDVLNVGVQGVASALDRVDRAERWTWMYLVVARKPVPAAAWR